MKKASAKDKIGWVRRIQEIICFLLIFFGMVVCVESILDIQIPFLFSVPAVVGLALCVWIMGLGEKYKLALVTVFIGLMIFVWKKYQEILLVYWKEIENKILELINHYYRTDYVLWYLEDKVNNTWILLLLACVLLGILEGILLLKGRNRKSHVWFTAFLPVSVIAAILLVGKAPSSLGVLLILAGILAEVLDFRQRGTILMGGAIVFSVSCSILLVQNEALWKQIQTWHEKWQVKQLALEDRMLEAMEEVGKISLFSNKEQSKYHVNNEEPKYTGKEVFEITVDYPISQNLYIKGFVGGEYEDGNWTKVSRQEFSDWAQKQGGTEEEYSKIVHSFPYEFLTDAPDTISMNLGKNMKVSIELKDEVKGFSLMPYFTQIPEEQPVRADGTVSPGKQKKFYWNSYMKLSDHDIEYAGASFDENYLLQYTHLEPDQVRRYQIFQAYQDYAKEMYTKLPEQGLERLRAYAKEQKEQQEEEFERTQDAIFEKLTSSSQVGWTEDVLKQILTESELQVFQSTQRQRTNQMIQQMLWEDNWYSLDLDKVPKDKDKIEYFLFEQHKGFCVHFASAATLLFRMNGVPARFVSGYMVKPSDFSKNEDGTWTAVVTDEQAHAWTEIFQDNIGFYPLETTPPSYTELLANLKEGEILSNAVKQKEEEEHPKSQKEQNLEAKEKKASGEQKEPEESKKEIKGTKQAKDNSEKENIHPVLYLSLIVAGTMILFLVVLYSRKNIKRKRLERCLQTDRTRAVKEIAKELHKILCLLGQSRRKGMADLEYRKMLQQELPEVKWEQAFSIFQKAAFSKNGVVETEYQEVFCVYEKLKGKLMEKRGVKSWYFRYIKIYP